MKKFILVFLVLLLILLPVSAVFADNTENAENEIYNALKKNGLNEIYVSIENGTTVVKLGFDVLPKNIAPILLDTALESFKIYDKADGVLVEEHVNDSPEFAIFLNGKDLSDYFKGKLTDDEIAELAIPVDIKSDFSELSDDLLEYNFLAENIYYENGTLNILGDYLGKKGDFNTDFLGALFFAVQDCPYAKNISLKLRNGKMFNVATVESGAVLDLTNNVITPAEFEKKVQIYKETPGKFSLVNFVSNEKNENGLFGIVALILSLVLFFAAHKKKSRVAKILKAKRIDINRIPKGKNRVYGKFNGIVRAENPLIAPLSKKQTVFYEEITKKKSNIKKRDVHAINFYIQNAKGRDKKLLIKKENMPDFDAPLLQKQKIIEQNIEIYEKGIENGRKVFFIGGMERQDDGNFVFVKRPNYPNFIGMHNERKLTGHTVRTANMLKLLGFLSFAVFAYFVFLYFR